MDHLDIDPNGVEEGEERAGTPVSTYTRTMKIAYRRVAGRWIGMYETRVYRPDGSIFRNELVDLDEVCLL